MTPDLNLGFSDHPHSPLEPEEPQIQVTFDSDVVEIMGETSIDLTQALSLAGDLKDIHLTHRMSQDQS